MIARFIFGTLLLGSILLMGSDGEWFPYANLVGCVILIAVGILANMISHD